MNLEWNKAGTTKAVLDVSVENNGQLHYVLNKGGKGKPLDGRAMNVEALMDVVAANRRVMLKEGGAVERAGEATA